MPARRNGWPGRRRGVIQASLHEGRRGRGRDQHAVAVAAGELQHVGTRGGDHDRDVAATIGQPAARHLECLALEVGHLAGEQLAADLHRLADRHQRLGRVDAGRLEIGRSARAEAEDHPAGIHLVEAGRRHGDVDRMRRVRAHRHQRDPDLLRGGERKRRSRHRITQEEMAGDPQGRGAALFRRLRLGRDAGDRRAAVHRDAELSHR